MTTAPRLLQTMENSGEPERNFKSTNLSLRQPFQKYSESATEQVLSIVSPRDRTSLYTQGRSASSNRRDNRPKEEDADNCRLSRPIPSSHFNVASNSTEPPNPFSKVLPNTNQTETPRGSGDFLTVSNNSSESLASEYVGQDTKRVPAGPWQSRQSSLLGLAPKSKRPDKLMMGYVQLSGNFSIDASLVDKSAFDETRRKAIVGDQGGGGLVREDTRKRESGFFGSFSWGSIGAPLEGLLGGNQLSSIRNSKESDRDVPILSTPQSVLFVDLRLDPGESKSFEYRHLLPKGVPPSHMGKAIKVKYQLIIGTQRSAANTQTHHLRHVNVPFRVLPGVNGMWSLTADAAEGK